MSANNYIRINKTTFNVEEADMDTGEKCIEIGKGESLEHAIKLAQEFMQEWPVEYGIHFTE